MFLDPVPPTFSLPSLARLASSSLEQLSLALQNLRSIYIEPPPTSAKRLPKHNLQDQSVPDSGYASAEEDEGGDTCDDNADSFDLDVLRADSFERDFAIRWLTGFTARSDVWLASAESDEEADARTELIDSVASLLAFFTGEHEKEDDSLTRHFTFAGPHTVEVQLNDAPLDHADHTSVGLQSWASSIVLSERLCASPSSFGLECKGEEPLRILELGAGTGLLSIVTAKLFHPQHAPRTRSATIIATDFHSSVLANLQSNVDTNFGCSSSPPCVSVLPLDWEHPSYEGLLADHFDIILAADVIYHPQHAQWIQKCVQKLLKPHGVFWLIIALRVNGRHERLSETVREVFPMAKDVKERELAILELERLRRHDGVGRADESGYMLYKVGWVEG